MKFNKIHYQNCETGSVLTAAEIFDFHMYFAMLKISDDNTEFTCSPGGKKNFPQVLQH